MAGDDQLSRNAAPGRWLWLMIWTTLMCFHRVLEWLVKSVERRAFRTLDGGLVKTERGPQSRLPSMESGTVPTVVPETERHEELGKFRLDLILCCSSWSEPGDLFHLGRM